jgi:acyl-CoA synthetase (AMP-forming)/AMP-acid ligase II
VVLSHANLLHNTAQIAKRFEVEADSQGMIWLPPYHDMGLVGGILEGVFAGFPIALMAPVAFLQRPVRWLQAISRTQATISGGPNFAYDLCVERIPSAQRAGLDLSSWQVAFNGAEPVHEATLRRFADAFSPHGFRPNAFYPCYGLAEATLMVAGGSASAPPIVTQLANSQTTVVGNGTAIDDQTLVIVDPATSRPCQPGQIGEVWVAGPSVAAGYWAQPELTREIFAADLSGTQHLGSRPQAADLPGAGPFLRTGDLGFVQDGELFITGRLKSVLILNGRKLQAEDLEATLNELQAGTSVAIAVEHDAQERLVIIHELDRHASPDFDAIVKQIRLRVAEAHQVPVWAVLLVRRGPVPTTSSGKVQRGACRDAFLAGRLTAIHAWKATRP